MVLPIIRSRLKDVSPSFNAKTYKCISSRFPSRESQWFHLSSVPDSEMSAQVSMQRLTSIFREPTLSRSERAAVSPIIPSRLKGVSPNLLKLLSSADQERKCYPVRDLLASFKFDLRCSKVISVSNPRRDETHLDFDRRTLLIPYGDALYHHTPSRGQGPRLQLIGPRWLYGTSRRRSKSTRGQWVM